MPPGKTGKETEEPRYRFTVKVERIDASEYRGGSLTTKFEHTPETMKSTVWKEIAHAFDVFFTDGPKD